jgi:hypothetical protein
MYEAKGLCLYEAKGQRHGDPRTVIAFMMMTDCTTGYN